MLKGHVFSKQIFENPIFALFIDIFLQGKCGIANYKNNMEVTYSASVLNVSSGAICIRGRFLEEDTNTSVPVGSESGFCKLVLEINLDNKNTESDFTQASYKILKNPSSYPALTQTNIVKNNAGIYQYELARFKVNATGIVEFQDMRTFLDFESIFEKIEEMAKEVIKKIENELANVENGSAYMLSSKIKTGATVPTEDELSEGDIYLQYFD